MEARCGDDMDDTNTRTLSTTAYADASACLRRFYYAHVARLVPKPSSTARSIRIGLWLHKAIADSYRGADWRKSLDDLALWCLERNVPGEEVRRVQEECVEILEGYFSYWRSKGDDWEILAVEEPLYVYVRKDLRLRATVDAVIRNRYGVWVVEHKSTAEIPPASWRAVDPQTAIQYLAAVASGYKVDGFLFDYILTKVPPIPHVKEDGRFTTRNVITTSRAFAAAEQACRARWKGDEEDLESYLSQARAAMVADGQFYQRHYVVRPEEHILETMRDVSATVRAIEDSERSGHWRRSFHVVSCRRFCRYGALCMSEYVGGGPNSAMRESNFTVENDESTREGR